MRPLVVLVDGTSLPEVPFESYRFTFPVQDAELTPEHIEEFGLREGLVKFGKALAEQRGAEGVEIYSIGVTFLLKKQEKMGYKLTEKERKDGESA